MSRPLVVTAAAGLLDELLRLAAAADAEVEVAAEAGTARAAWRSAPLVLVGADLLDALTGLGLPRRSDVVVVSTDLDDATVWRRAVAVGAEHVAFLPDGEVWLVERVRAAARAGAPTARLIGVVGGRGGAGATTLAVALALTGLRRGLRTLLVDADPLAGGIDLVLGGESAPGPRWPDLAAVDAPLTATELTRVLPRLDEMTVLSGGRHGPARIPPQRLRDLLRAGRREADLVVVDLPRAGDDATQVVLGTLDTLLVVVPAEVRACAAAARIAQTAEPYVDDLRLVVRGPAPSGLTGEQVAAAVGRPLAGWLPAEPGLAAALERGDAPARNSRGPLARLCGSLLDALIAEAAA